MRRSRLPQAGLVRRSAKDRWRGPEERQSPKRLVDRGRLQNDHERGVARPDQDEIREMPFGADVVAGAAAVQAGTGHVDNGRARQLPVRPVLLPMAFQTAPGSRSQSGPCRGCPVPSVGSILAKISGPQVLTFTGSKPLRNDTENTAPSAASSRSGSRRDHTRGRGCNRMTCRNIWSSCRFGIVPEWRDSRRAGPC